MLTSRIYKYIPVGSTQNRGRIIPVFLPFAGCPFHCMFCAQDIQTGVGQFCFEDALDKMESEAKELLQKILAQVDQKQTCFEIAFYGGTFTALSAPRIKACLERFSTIKQYCENMGVRVYGRCSTRPDCLTLVKDTIPVPELLRSAGIDLIELGIQSFDNNALAKIGRGYTSDVALSACALVKDKGFALGIQLMAGLIEQDNDVFLEDVRTALSFSPDCMRYYPCLVPKGTELEKLWKKERYTPWSTQDTVNTLGHALYLAWQKEVPVIRLSVAPEDAFDKMIVAGPRHPALGSLVQAKALLLSVQHALKEGNVGRAESLGVKESCDTEKNADTKERCNNKESFGVFGTEANSGTEKKIGRAENLDRAESFYRVDNADTEERYNKKKCVIKEVDSKESTQTKQYNLHVPKSFQGFIFGQKNALKAEWTKLIPLDQIFFDADTFESYKTNEKVSTKKAFFSVNK